MADSLGQVGLPPIQVQPLGYAGSPLNYTPVVYAARAPTVNDVNYPTSCEWVDSATQDIWKLHGFLSGDANWKLISTGSLPGGTVVSLSDTANTQVSPDAAGNIQLTAGAGVSIVSTPASNLLTISLTGGGIAIDQIAVQANTAPGVNPVSPDGAGLLTINGAAVAAHSVPIETRSRALNALNVEVQRAAATATTDTTSQGIASFDSADFSIDANGYVSLNGSGITLWQTTSVNVANMSVNRGYICIAPGGALTLGLPTTSALGDELEITLDGATSFQITQGAGQQIRMGNQQTTAGAAGSLTTTAQGDTLRLVCQTANLKWNVLSTMGNFVVA